MALKKMWTLKNVIGKMFNSEFADFVCGKVIFEVIFGIWQCGHELLTVAVRERWLTRVTAPTEDGHRLRLCSNPASAVEDATRNAVQLEDLKNSRAKPSQSGFLSLCISTELLSSLNSSAP